MLPDYRKLAIGSQNLALYHPVCFADYTEAELHQGSIKTHAYQEGTQTHPNVGYVSTGKCPRIHQGKGCTLWLQKCGMQQSHYHPARLGPPLIGPEKSSLERCSAVIWPSLHPKTEVPVHKLFPSLSHFITPRSGSTLILVLLHCCSFLPYICIKIYTRRIVTFQN